MSASRPFRDRSRTAPWVDGRKAVERYTAGGRRWWILSTANWIVELAKWVSSTPNFRVCETLAMVLAAPDCRFGRYRVCEQTPRRGKADMQHQAFACCSNSCSTIVVFITLHALGFWAAPPCHQPPASEDGSIRMESRSGDGSSPGPPPRLHHRPAGTIEDPPVGQARFGGFPGRVANLVSLGTPSASSRPIWGCVSGSAGGHKKRGESRVEDEDKARNPFPPRVPRVSLAAIRPPPVWPPSTNSGLHLSWRNLGV